MRKGYLLDLSDTPRLAAFGRSALDAFDPLIYDGDRLYLIPTELRANYLSASVQGFEAIGRNIPASQPELMDLVRWWAAEGHQQHEGYVLFDLPKPKARLKQIIHLCYLDSLLGAGEPLQFDKAGYGGLMQEAEAMDLSAIDLSYAEMFGDGSQPRSPLIGTSLQYQASWSRLDTRYTHLMALSLDGETPAYTLGAASFVGIPATSRHPEEAKRFISAYIDNMEPMLKAGLSRDWAEPIVNPDYEADYRSQHAAVQQQKRLYEEAEEGPAKRQYAADLHVMQEELGSFEQRHKYLLTAEDLQAHQARMGLPG